jgi:hypothetical protein
LRGGEEMTDPGEYWISGMSFDRAQCAELFKTSNLMQNCPALNSDELIRLGCLPWTVGSIAIMKNVEVNSIGFREQEDALEPTNRILKILKNPALFNEITEKEFDKKIVGENEARKVIFLCAAGGRLVENCQIASYNLLVNDDAGTGKDYVTYNTLSILPKDIFVHKTRITPTALTYWHDSKNEPNWTWDGKVFYPEDIGETVLNSDVFKVMTSKGSKATVTIKQKAVDIDISGKPVIITTTATATPSPELTRRFVILNLDSSQDQTKEIMKRHSTYKRDGLVPEYDSAYTEAMAYLKRVKVKILFAGVIDRYFPTTNIVMRTHYPRFLDFICASAAFHQYQREREGDFILANGNDYDIARECFLKLCSNKYMVSLTINQKKILALFEENPHLKASASQLLTKMQGSIKTVYSMQTNLRNLVKYGLLESMTDLDSLNREMEVFCLAKSYNPNEQINIPLYEELCIISEAPKISELNETTKINEISKDTSDVSVIIPKNHERSPYQSGITLVV